ncbi:MAG TPA: oligosaccharide flippase family protein [Sphingopyxis sp.]|nr:oligosaccharide flippase family protein [Sphingopyxis sp.]HMP44165.1 oligosaccharide flippase family protein [Sphingopyxis sp.]HMQ18339.1 oligosaccharide flippase family protein [Sphingopyxis sp.]
MISRLLKLRHSSFLRSTATLSGGQLLATMIGFSFAPILSRLYTPQDYGVLATYTAVAVILGMIANLCLSRAVVAEADEDQAHALLGLCLLLAIGFAGLTLGLVLLFSAVDFAGLEQLGFWLFLLPATVLASGTGSALLAWANRHHRYRLMSSYQLVNVIGASGGALALAWAGFGPRGLMLGYFLGQFAALLCIWVGNRDVLPSLRRVNWTRMKRAGGAHRNYMVWTTPTALIENISSASPVLVLSFWGNMLGIVGHYNRARGLLMMPMGMLGSSIAQVFFRRAAQDMARDGHCRTIFWRLIAGMTAISLPSFAVLALIAPQLFVFVLGPQWSEAGHIARILAPVMALQLIVMPASKVIWLYGRQRLDFFLSVLFAVTTTSAVASVAFLGFEPEIAIDVFAGVQILLYLAYLASSILIVERDHRARQEQIAETAPIRK